MLELDIGRTPDILREEYLDVYGGIQSEILNIQDLRKIQIKVQQTWEKQTDPK